MQLRASTSDEGKILLREVFQLTDERGMVAFRISGLTTLVKTKAEITAVPTS